MSFGFSSNYLNSEKSIQNLKNKSEILIQNQNFELALNLYLKILEIESQIYKEDNFELAETYDKIAELYISLNNYSDALPYIIKSIDIYQNNLLNPKDRLVSSLKNIREVYEKQNKFILLDKSDRLIKSLEGINSIYSIEDFFTEVDLLNQTIEDTAFTFLDLAKSYKSRGLYSQAAENFSKALDLPASSLDFNYYYNFIMQDSTHTPQMLNAFQFLSQSDSSSYGSYFYLSLLNKKLNNQKDYIDYMKKYIDVVGNSEKANYLQAQYYFDEKQYIESLLFLQKILSNNKNSILARFMTAECLFYLDSFSDAITAFEIVLVNDPYHVAARYHLAQSHIKLENFNKSIKELTQVLLLSPDYKDTY